MPKDPKRRQQKMLKKRQKQKQKKKQTSRTSGTTSEVAIIHRARRYPIHECLISAGWREQGIAVVVIARRQSEGLIVFGSCVVDLQCLGVKDAFARANFPVSRYQEEFRQRLVVEQDVQPCSRELAHQVIYGAIDFAADLGFEPHEDFRLARHLLEERESIPPSDMIEFGKDGKPFYVSGPFDDVERIMNRLQSKVGKDGFHYLMGIDPRAVPPSVWDE